MKSLIRVLFVTFAMLTASVAWSHNYTVGSITIDHPWSRATVAGIPNGVSYFVLENQGNEADRLVSVSSPVAEVAELHTHEKDGDVLRMRQVHGIEIPAGKTVALEPGGLHVMLMTLKEPLEQGTSFPLTLNFEKAGSVTVDVQVDRIGKKKGDRQHMDDGNHDQHQH